MRSVNILLLVAAAVLLQCMNPGSGSSTESAKVAGILYNEDGTRAAGAKVACIPRRHNPYTGEHTGGDSTTTDDTGAYKFKTMPADSYNIIASLDTGYTYIDPIIVTSDSNMTVPPDTLRYAGSVQGIVELQPGDDARTVFMIFMGTHLVRMPSVAAGNFDIGTLGEGRYRVRLLTTLDDYDVMDTAFTVRAGVDSVLPQPIVLNYTGIPVPQGLRIVYDTLKQIVTLVWNTPTNGRPVAGYNIYRKHQDSTIALLRSGVTDTTYSDSTGIQDIIYEYRVAAVDTNTTEGTRSTSVSVTVLPAFTITDTLFTMGGYGWIYAVERDVYGNYVVVNGTAYYPTPAKIERYTSAGALINSWDIPNGVEETYIFNCIAIDDSNTIFVVTKDNKVIRYDTAGGLLSQFQYPRTASGFGILTDTLYFSNSTAHMVHAYSIIGDSLFSWGSNGNGDGQFSNIGAIRTDIIMENILIEDAYNYARIQTFNRNGNFISSLSFPTLGKDGGELDIRNDTVLVCGTSIFAFTANGTFIFRYRNLSFQRKAIFDNLTNDILLFNLTGEVIRISRR